MPTRVQFPAEIAPIVQCIEETDRISLRGIMAGRYIRNGYDTTAWITRLAEIAGHDNFTELHAYKHYRAIVAVGEATAPV